MLRIGVGRLVDDPLIKHSRPGESGEPVNISIDVYVHPLISMFPTVQALIQAEEHLGHGLNLLNYKPSQGGRSRWNARRIVGAMGVIFAELGK